MKKNRNHSRILLLRSILTVVLFALFISCEDDKDKKEKVAEYDPNKPIELTSFKPQEGGIRDKFLLYGNNFGGDASKVKVYFNKTRAAVVSAKGDIMYAIVPKLPGDICRISVVIGEDSVVYDETFAYNTTVSVSTITGNGTQAFKAGTLAEGQVYARYIAVDNENNIFASVRDAGSYGVVRINENENIVTPLIMSTSSSPLNPNAPAVDLTTGIITVPNDVAAQEYYTFDPKEVWAPRTHTMMFDGFTPKDQWKYAMASSPYDGCIYTRYGNGEVVRLDPSTKKATLIYQTNSGAGYGLAFHPLKPYLLYFAMHSNVSGYGNSICVLDIRDPEGSGGLKRLSSPILGGGHRDGPLEDAQFNNPRQLFFDPDGNLFVADYNNHCIRMITPDNMVETVVGLPGTAGMKDGGRYDALLKNPWGLAVGKDGTVYISDYGNARIRKLVIE